MKRDGVKSAHNERTYTDADGTIRVVYHNTEILTLRPDGSVRLDTGGWLTTSTMTHIRNALRRNHIPGNVSRAGGAFTFFRWLYGTPEIAETLRADGGTAIIVAPHRAYRAPIVCEHAECQRDAGGVRLPCRFQNSNGLPLVAAVR